MDKIIKSFIEKAKKDKQILAVALFGSATRNQNHRDIDLCVFLNKKRDDKEATKKRIKLLGESSDKLDITIFQQLPIYIQIRVLKEGKILFCKNQDKLYEIAFDTLKKFGDFKKPYYMYLEKVKNGPRKNTLKI